MIELARRAMLCFIIAAAIGCQPAERLSPDITANRQPTSAQLTPVNEKPTTSASPAFNRDESPVPDRFTLVRYAANNGSLTSLLVAEAQRAVDSGRQPYVEFYADWCGPCKALRRSLSDQRMIGAFTDTYIIQLDWDTWEDQLDEAGFTVEAVPAFFEINSDGKPTGRTITGAAWGEDIPENMAPPLKKFFAKY
jgi:thiol-disulfide isomerase/thioredoxin